MQDRVQLTPAQILVLGFAGLILLGTVLLMLPVSSAAGKVTPFLTALFTATSAVCVTGLVVVDTATYWSPFGHAVILGLIQVGGLGIMTMSSVAAFIVGKRITLRERLVMREAFGSVSLSGLVRLVQQVLLITVVIELAGAIILALRWSADYPWPKAVWLGIFHAVSAFCNAGFDLFSTSLVRFVDDLVVIPTVSALIFLGGIGFPVILELWHWLRRRCCERLSLHTRLVLQVSALLIFAGTLLIYVFERDNPATLQPLSPLGQWLAAFFQSVSPRTAGYNSIDIGQMREVTLFLIITFMFVGASPASTGGGIKTSTFGALMAAVWSVIRGRHEVELAERRLARDIVDKSLAIVAIAIGIVLTMTALILTTHPFDLVDAMFEVTSAFGTVGLSTGVTPHLSGLGQILITLTMFVGRVGPLTLAVALAQRSVARTPAVRYPEDRVMIG